MLVLPPAPRSMKIAPLLLLKTAIFVVIPHAGLAASTTKYENDLALVGERSSLCQWCREPEEVI